MPRHQFHKKHQRLIGIFLFLAILTGFVLAWQLPYTTLMMGLFIGAVVSVYFLTILFRDIFIPKEIIVASIYTGGILIGPLSLFETVNLKVAIIGLELWTMAVFNLLLFSVIEKNQDIKDGSQSWVIRFSSDQTTRIMNLLLFSTFFLAVLAIVLYRDDGYYFWFQIILILMAMTLELIKKKPKLFMRHENYRLLGDAVFLFPAILLIF